MYNVMAYDVPWKKHPVLTDRVSTHEEEYGEFEDLRAALKFCKWKSAKNNQWTGAPHPFHLFYISEYIGEDDPLPQHKSAEEWEEEINRRQYGEIKSNL